MSTTTINRRNWLKRTALFTAGAAVTPGIGLQAKSTLNTATKENFFEYHLPMWEWERTKRPELKARLLANENPFGPSDKTRLAIMESVAMGNRYGHGDAAALIKMIAEKEGVSEDHIILGPGSTDLLEKTAITHFMEGGNIVSADPAYMSLIKTAMAFNAKWNKVPLTSDWAHDLKGMEAAVDDDTKLIYVCNPNNPTGSITPADDLRAFCRKMADKVPIFVDEAYLDYLLDDPMKSSMVDLLKEGKNVIIARTFSKIHAMAGLRIGYAVALPETIEKITSMVRSTMGLCVTSLRGAMASLADETFQTNSREWTKESREIVYAGLDEMGFDFVPSYTSFILFPIALEGQAFLKKMYGEGVGVRAFEVFGKPYCRVSMGTPEEMSMFMDALKKVLV